MTTTALDLDSLHLKTGAHATRSQGVCVMEAVAWYAGKDHSDMPECVSPVLRQYGMRLNDRLNDVDRQQLKQFIPALVGTAGDGKDDRRREIASEVLMREWLPAWLRLARMDDLAAQAEQGAGLQGAELRTALRAIRDLTYKERMVRRDKLKADIQARLMEKWAGQQPVAAAVAAAVAVADAVAVAAADAAAAAAAAAVAAAVADAVADAAADAAAVAAAVAVAVADAVAAIKPYSDEWYRMRNKVYDAVYTAVKAQYEQSPAFAEIRALRDSQLQAGIDLYARLIEAS